MENLCCQFLYILLFGKEIFPMEDFFFFLNVVPSSQCSESQEDTQREGVRFRRALHYFFFFSKTSAHSAVPAAS